MTDMVIPWVVAGIPFAGALVCLAFGSDPYRVKMCAIGSSVISLAATAGVAGRIPIPSDGLLPLYLLPIAAVVATLGQPVHELHRLSWTLTLIFLGLGMAVLTGGNTFGPLCLIGQISDLRGQRVELLIQFGECLFHRALLNCSICRPWSCAPAAAIPVP